MKPSTIRFISIPAPVLESRDLGANEKLVYGCLRFHQGSRGQCWPSKVTIAEEVGISPRCVLTAIGKLQAAGLITISPPGLSVERVPGSPG